MPAIPQQVIPTDNAGSSFGRAGAQQQDENHHSLSDMGGGANVLVHPSQQRSDASWPDYSTDDDLRGKLAGGHDFGCNSNHFASLSSFGGEAGEAGQKNFPLCEEKRFEFVPVVETATSNREEADRGEAGHATAGGKHEEGTTTTEKSPLTRSQSQPELSALVRTLMKYSSSSSSGTGMKKSAQKGRCNLEHGLVDATSEPLKPGDYHKSLDYNARLHDLQHLLLLQQKSPVYDRFWKAVREHERTPGLKNYNDRFGF